VCVGVVGSVNVAIVIGEPLRTQVSHLVDYTNMPAKGLPRWGLHTGECTLPPEIWPLGNEHFPVWIERSPAKRPRWVVNAAQLGVHIGECIRPSADSPRGDVHAWEDSYGKTSHVWED
jgi:hypothetical protein